MSSLRIAVLRCDIGDPPVPNPPVTAYEDVFGPDGPDTVLGGWTRATSGHPDLGGSTVVRELLRMSPSELVDEDATERDRRGRVVTYGMSRRKVGDRAVALAEEAGHDMDRFDGIVVVANQGDLRHEGRPVRPYRGGASSLSDGRLMCNLAVDETLYLMAHEVGHVLGYPEAYGVRTRAWGWNEPPFDLTPQYGDPFCVMSARVRPGGDAAFDYLSTRPLSAEWPAATFTSAGPGPALALVRRVEPAALTGSVQRLRHDEWHAPHPVVRLHAATDPDPARTRLLVLDGPDRQRGPDVEHTVYVEYRRSEGLDQGLAPDPSARALACPAVVVHELVDTALCVPPDEDDTDLPACTADDGAVTARGRLDRQGLQVHFRARIPVPPPPSRDWRSRSGALVSLVDVAPDGSWVEVSVRPATSSDRTVTLARPVTVELGRTVAFVGRESLPSLCGGGRGPQRPGAPVLTRRYRYTVDVVDEAVTLRAAVTGFGNGTPTGPTGDDPRLIWSVAGTAVTAPALGDPPVRSTVVPTLPVHRYDLRTGESLDTIPAPASIRYEARGDGSLTLTSPGTNGNVTVPVTVTATPASGRDGLRSATFPVHFQGHRRTRDPALARDLRRCLSRILDPSRHTQFESPPWLRGPRFRREREDPRATHPERYLDADPVLLGLAEQVHAQLLRAGDRKRARELAEVAHDVLGIRLAT